MPPKKRAVAGSKVAASEPKNLQKKNVPGKLGHPAKNATTDPLPANAPGRPSKRKREAEDDHDRKKLKTSPRVVAVPAHLKVHTKRAINQAPTQKLNVYVCGDVSAGELGLGPRIKKATTPSLNPNLSGVVQVAVGGMHCLALTHDNQILSWGVNDIGALGRDTTWEGGVIDIEDADSDRDDETNPLESTPAAVPMEHFPEGTVFTQIAAGDSCSFVLTADGHVYGWGSFRDQEGKRGFALDKKGKLIKMQRTPMLIPTLKDIVQLACGADHILALDKNGHVHAWGNGQQHQLGRRIVERTRNNSLLPRGVAISRKKIVYVGCGSYHSFAIDANGDLWAWGLNGYGQAGAPVVEDDDDTLVVSPPRKMDTLQGKKMKVVEGGAHHSVGVTQDGECLVWGRADGGQSGVDLKSLPDENVVRDSRGRVRIISVPTAVPDISAVTATAGSDHTIAITTDGKAYSWGFNATYQTGHGPDAAPKDFGDDDDDDDPEDINIAKILDTKTLKDVKLNWAGAGGQFSVFTAPLDESKE